MKSCVKASVERPDIWQTPDMEQTMCQQQLQSCCTKGSASLCLNQNADAADDSVASERLKEHTAAYIASELNQLVMQGTALRLSLPCSSF